MLDWNIFRAVVLVLAFGNIGRFCFDYCDFCAIFYRDCQVWLRVKRVTRFRRRQGIYGPGY